MGAVVLAVVMMAATACSGGDDDNSGAACWFEGDAAVAAATEDGAEVDNDYYVRNSNPRTFTETFANRTGPATCVEAGSPETFPCPTDDVPHLSPATYEPVTINGHEASAYPIVWLHVTDAAPDYLFLRFTP